MEHFFQIAQSQVRMVVDGAFADCLQVLKNISKCCVSRMEDGVVDNVTVMGFTNSAA